MNAVMTVDAPAAELEAAVRACINEIYDPCSVAAGNPLGLIDMGLLTHLHVDEHGYVNVRLRVTFAGCMMMPLLAGSAEESIAALPGVCGVTVEVETAITWTPADMKARAQAIPTPQLRVNPTSEPIGGSKREVL